MSLVLMKQTKTGPHCCGGFGMPNIFDSVKEALPFLKDFAPHFSDGELLLKNRETGELMTVNQEGLIILPTEEKGAA